ncbi:CBS domain protein [Enhygromyxa salina]|uniref:CBS domain protein n=1 Tax=Enhygromyxa salina TaxID=215803 RepID=A0A0C1ZMT4_9BACT|nr:CBS domain-containing protein [Enhygromyxa salina]KIG18744.1 CBS domain protein [Enhygromyxa salina]
MTPQPHTIGDDQTLALARERMHEHGVRHLPVLHGGHLVGVLSSRDIALVEALPGVDITTLTVDEAMSEEPWTVEATANLSWVAETMAARRIGTAVVVEREGSDQVLGVFTTTDALLALANLAGESASE